MGAAVKITRLDHSAAGLRREASRCGDSRVTCRMLAIAQAMDGVSRTEAAEACGMDRQTLRDWIHRYNAAGIAGLADLPRSGRTAALSAEQQAEFRSLVLAGPELARDGVVRWRCIDLRSKIAERFEVTMHERSVGKLLHRLGLSRVQPRPFNPKQNLEAQEAFKKTSPNW